ncbi:MAG: oligoribonuclease [Kofleriaceae bacterium]
MLLWIDLETTGLDASTDHVLEVAAIVTDDNLDEVARFHRVVYSPRADKVCHALATGLVAPGMHHTVAQAVVEMHAKTGLWAESRRGQALATVDSDLAEFIKNHATRVDERPETDPVRIRAGYATRQTRVPPQLAGSTISFDRAFMATRLPTAERALHYRNVDVTSFNEVARRFWPAIHESRPRADDGAHRAMVDIELSIAQLKYYLAHIGPVGTHVIKYVGFPVTIPSMDSLRVTCEVTL